jgi:hypothetical protein
MFYKCRLDFRQTGLIFKENKVGPLPFCGVRLPQEEGSSPVDELLMLGATAVLQQCCRWIEREKRVTTPIVLSSKFLYMPWSSNLAEIEKLRLNPLTCR